MAKHFDRSPKGDHPVVRFRTDKQTRKRLARLAKHRKQPSVSQLLRDLVNDAYKRAGF